MDETTTLLKLLTEANGVPGHEAKVREVVKGYLKKIGDLSQDNIGSLICTLSSSLKTPLVMLASHIDEIGFMIKHITKEGFLRFIQLGGWFDQVLLGQRVEIQTHNGVVVGVIGAVPPHLLSPEDRKKIVEKKDMYIDIGATSILLLKNRLHGLRRSGGLEIMPGDDHLHLMFPGNGDQMSP